MPGGLTFASGSSNVSKLSHRVAMIDSYLQAQMQSEGDGHSYTHKRESHKRESRWSGGCWLFSFTLPTCLTLDSKTIQDYPRRMTTISVNSDPYRLSDIHKIHPPPLRVKRGGKEERKRIGNSIYMHKYTPSLYCQARFLTCLGTA